MKLTAVLLLLGGVLLTGWGLFVLYVAANNYEARSEFPTWWGYAVAAVLLVLGGLLLALGRAAYRRQRT